MRVGLLECDHVDDRNRDVAGDYRDMFSELLRAAAPQIEVVPFDVTAGELPSSPDECGGWLATGSRMSVYDDEEWIEAASAFLRRLRDTRARYVGICFGHQLLAHALGGEVERSTSGWGVGAHPMEVRAHEGWMRPPEREANLLFMHQDQVTRLPDSAVLLGTTDHCPIAMFRVDHTMLGLQAHPEFSRSYLTRLLDERVARIGEAETEAARTSLGLPLDDVLAARWIVRFLGPS